MNININLDFLKPIKDKMIEFWDQYKSKIITGLLIFFISYSVFNTYFSTCHVFHDNNKVTNNPINANYRSDMNFLECIAEQHSCVYKNLKNGIDLQGIIEGCKDEDYCANPITVSK
jgi:hypothetical protein